MSTLIKIADIAALHRDSILRWKTEGLSLEQQGFLRLAEENHAFNYQLWHAEDRARREDMGHEFVYQAKREIDYCNQQRNNRMEAMDEWLFIHLQPAQAEHCPVHSETPGMIIDRLSIMALKSYHMELQTRRHEVDESHRQTCLLKLNTITAQQQQLLACLDLFIEEILAKSRTFRVYHQFKMYNDPALNPELYSAHSD